MGLPKGKVGRFIFRKIRGRIIRINIKNSADTVAQASSYAGDKFRKITAEVAEHSDDFGRPNVIGSLNLRVPKKGVSAELLNVEVAKDFRKKGISKNLFQRAVDFLGRTNMKFLRSEDIQHVAQIKIRRQHGAYRAGTKLKNRAKFTADQFGPYGEETRRVNFRDAIDIIKQNNSPYSKGRQIKGTLMFKKGKLARKK